MTEPPLTRWRRAARPFVPGLAATAALAMVCNVVLDLSGLMDVEQYLWDYKTPAYLGLFVLGSLVLWALVGLVHAVVGRLKVTVALVATATALVAAANFEKVRLRHEPIYPSDSAFLGNIGFLGDVVGLRAVVLLVLCVFLVGGAGFAATAAVLRRLHDRQRSAHPHEVGRRARVALRLATGSLCLAALGYLSQFNDPGNDVRRAYEAMGAYWRPYSQERNYLGNGFVGGFLYNMHVPAMARPRGYSAAEMARVVARYRRTAERINRTRELHALDDVNVVMILSESFTDPEALRGVHLRADPIPYTRRLQASTTSGRMLAAQVGGGTANMEFEALTGMSVSQFAPQLGVPYQMLVPEYDTFPSTVGWFERNGHRTLAIHPFTTEMYRRREVYRVFGFDDFVWDAKMHHRAVVQHNRYISDSAAFDEVRGSIDSEDTPLFVNLVTMQNHLPYEGNYDDAQPVTGPAGNVMPEITQYVRGLTYTDQALKHFIDELSHSDEKTVVVFYGDHLPGVYPESVFEGNSDRAVLETPFFVWANFPGPTEKQPTTSPIYFMDLLLERAGAAVPPYYALLHEMRQEIAAMDGGIMVGSSDGMLAPGQMSARAARLLRDYRLVQYDLSVGRRYSARAMFEVPPRR